MFLQVSVILFTRGGCLVRGGSSGPGGAWWRPPPERLLLRAVRILLECILVTEASTESGTVISVIVKDRWFSDY